MKPVRVVVAPLQEKWVAGEVFGSFLSIAARAPVDGYAVDVGGTAREDMAREAAADRLLARPDFTHVLMLDIDHQHPADIVKRLSRWVIEDRSRAVVGALCYRRTPNYEPMAFIKNPDEQGWYFPFPSHHIGLVEVDRVGLGAVLIAREVFESMPEKGWFTWTYDRILEGEWPCTSLVFCDRAKAKGFHIYVDTETISPHMSTGWVDEKTHERFVATNPAAHAQLKEVEA